MINGNSAFAWGLVVGRLMCAPSRYPPTLKRVSGATNLGRNVKKRAGHCGPVDVLRVGSDCTGIGEVPGPML